MAKGVSRRRYAKVVSFWTETLANPRIAHRVRMQAAARLDGIYERCEAMVERAEVRRDAREARDRERVLTTPEAAARAFLTDGRQI